MAAKEETRTVDILAEPSQSRLRKEILNICDSYSHPWDVLAELCQNSVDAIRRQRRLHGEATTPHQISVVIDSTDRSIEVRDTGTGLPADHLVSLLAPHGTDKEQDADEIGEKGVGLTYTIYMSDGYEIETRCESDTTTGCMKGAAAWKNGQSDVIPLLTYTTRIEPARPE
jgi:HSP90 family molecular chaperone